MSTYFAQFDSTPATFAADLRGQILNSTDWSRPNSGTYPNLVKATTTRGAQMVLHIDDVAVTSRYASMAVYRTHDGTTGVDKLTRFLNWRNNTTGVTTDTLHCWVSAGKEHLLVSVEGPRLGEVNPETASSGSYRQSFFLGDITPYYSADTVPAVVCASPAVSINTGVAAGLTHAYAYVSRNAANSSSWVTAVLASVQMPMAAGVGTISAVDALQRVASDGNTYLWPYLVVETAAGIRGRVAKLFFCGYNTDGAATTVGTDPVTPTTAKYTYAGDTYIAMPVTKGCSTETWLPFGICGTSNASWYHQSPLVAVPYS